MRRNDDDDDDGGGGDDDDDEKDPPLKSIITCLLGERQLCKLKDSSDPLAYDLTVL